MLMAFHRTETYRSDRVAWRIDFLADGFPQTWHRFYPLSWTEEQVRADVVRILDREYPLTERRPRAARS